MIKRLVTIGLAIVSLLFVFNGQLLAQGDIESLRTGYIISLHNDTIEGRVDFDYNLEVIQVYPDNSLKILAYSPQMVKYFMITHENKIIKRYKTIYWNAIPELDYKTPSLFELVADGAIQLLAKERKISILNSFSDPMMTFYDPMFLPGYYETNKIEKTYFLHTGNSKIQELSNPKKDLIRLFPEVKSYCKDNELDLELEKDLITLIKQINLLKN